MQIQIFGAIIKKSYADISSNPDRPHFIKLPVEFHDNDMLDLIGTKAGAYGKHWVFAGSQGFEESNIHVTLNLDDGAKDEVTFVGRSALADLLKYLDKKGFQKKQKRIKS